MSGGRTLAAGGCRQPVSPWPRFLRDDPQLKLDYCSNVTGIDWPDKELTKKIKVKQKSWYGVEKEVEETSRRPCAPAIWKWFITCTRWN